MPGNIEMVETVAAGLDNLVEEVVFIGGAVAELYATHSAAEEIRPTKDVDITVESISRSDFNRIEEKLRGLGFQNDVSQGAPLCRWGYKSVKVDIMPADKDILGFGNEWYIYGIKNKIPAKLPSGKRIYIFPPPVYLCSKLQAVLDRGVSDLRTSTDFEDVIYVVDNSSHLDDDFSSSGTNVKIFLREVFSRLKQMHVFKEAVQCALPITAEDRVEEVINRINMFL